MEDHGASIKTMKLYYHVERIFNELKEIGYKPPTKLKVEDVCQFDQYHYHGVESVQGVIDSMKLNEAHKILDIGSGIGGPARYLAHKSGCCVTAIEIQSDLHETGKELTTYCGLDSKVSHVCGDILYADLGMNTYDAIVSWLVFLHIPNKTELFKQCLNHLKPTGKVYIEDIVELNAFTEDDKKDLEEAVFCKDLLNREEYVRYLKDAGFVDIQFEDVTAQWKTFVNSRYKEFCSKKERHIRVHGKDVYEALEYFYRVVSELFNRGNLGGAKIIASRKE